MKIISNKRINHILAVFTCVIISILLFFLFLRMGNYPKLWIILSFIIAMIFSFDDRKIIPKDSRGFLLWRGKKLKDKKGNEITLNSGMYFLFFIFSVSIEKPKND